MPTFRRRIGILADAPPFSFPDEHMSKDYEPRMHSAEHILNQTMVRMFGCGRCFSAHLNKKKSKCDYHFPRPLSEEEARALEQAVNEQITACLAVTEEMLDRRTAAEVYSLDRLPDNAVSTVRIVRIGDYDACPCIGEHVANTSEIGTFTIISHDHAEGVLRLRFKLKEAG